MDLIYWSQNFSPEQLKGIMESWSADKLKSNVHDLYSETKRLKLENEVFEQFLTDNEPDLLEGMEKTLKNAFEIVSSVNIMDGRKLSTVHPGVQQSGKQHPEEWPAEPSSSHYSSRKSLASYHDVRISFAVKFDLIARQVEYMEMSLRKFVHFYNKRIKIYRSEIEESGISLEEVNANRNAFEDRVVEDGYNPLTKKIPAESFTRYMQDWLKNAQVILEKLRMKVIYQRVQRKKLKQQYATKSRLVDNVEEVDFDQLETERVQLRRKLKLRKRELQEMKMMFSKTSSNCTTVKNTLQKKVVENDYLSVTFKETIKKTKQYEQEQKILGKQISELREKQAAVERCISIMRCPPTMDYIKAKHELSTLKQQLRRWRQKRDVQKNALECYEDLLAVEIKKSSLPKKDSSFWNNLIQRMSAYDDLSAETVFGSEDFLLRKSV